MRLINFGVGEIIDRLTILDLKLAHGGGDHFGTERAALLSKIQGRTLNGAWFEYALQLATVNGLLWRAEDDLRQWRSDQQLSPDELMRSGQLAFRIQELNDQRAHLIETINKLTGEHLGAEKI